MLSLQDVTVALDLYVTCLLTVNKLNKQTLWYLLSSVRDTVCLLYLSEAFVCLSVFQVMFYSTDSVEPGGTAP